MDIKPHIVGDGYTVYYGAFKGYACGICDCRDKLIVHGDGYSFKGQHRWGGDDWFMFPS